MILHLLPGIGVLLLACVVFGMAVDALCSEQYGPGAAAMGAVVVLVYLGCTLIG